MSIKIDINDVMDAHYDFHERIGIIMDSSSIMEGMARPVAISQVSRDLHKKYSPGYVLDILKIIQDEEKFNDFVNGGWHG